MRIGVVGGGLIGKERMKALQKIQQQVPIEIVGMFDSCEKVRRETSSSLGIANFSSLNDLLKDDLDWVIIAVPHDLAVGIATKAMDYRVNVLMEKPLGRNLCEADTLAHYAKISNVKLNLGLNYRFFRGTANLIADVKSKRFGDIISATFTLAHGNAPGMEKSWKLSPEKCGGGCLIDPGIHVFDLIKNCFPGDIKVLNVTGWKGFWKTGIEEETHITLRTAEGAIVVVDLSLNRWRSDFLIQINGIDGYGRVTGRGRSYGPQQYSIGNRWGWLSGESQKDTEMAQVKEYDADDSFYVETIRVLGLERNFEMLNEESYPLPACLESAMSAMKLMEQCKAQLKMNTY